MQLPLFRLEALRKAGFVWLAWRYYTGVQDVIERYPTTMSETVQRRFLMKETRGYGQPEKAGEWTVQQ